MNNSAINKELAHALRAILPFVPVGAPVRSAAVRALVDHDARVASEKREQVEFINRVLNNWPARRVYDTISFVPAIGRVTGTFADRDPFLVRRGQIDQTAAAEYAINAADAKIKAASAVQAEGGYAPRGLPVYVYGCDCDVCRRARRNAAWQATRRMFNPNINRGE